MNQFDNRERYPGINDSTLLAQILPSCGSIVRGREVHDIKSVAMEAGTERNRKKSCGPWAVVCVLSVSM